MFCITAFLFIFLASGGLFYSFLGTQDSPKYALKSWVEIQQVETKITNIAQLPLESTNHFVSAKCVRGDYESVYKSVLYSLFGFPEDIQSDIINRVVSQGVSTEETYRKSSILSTKEQGKAYSFLAFWNTRFTPGNEGTYSTCLIVSGVVIGLGDELVEWEETQSQVLVGSKPCECGRLWCAECPVFQEHNVKTPIYKKARITLETQTQLNDWMVNESILSAKHLLAKDSETSLWKRLTS